MVSLDRCGTFDALAGLVIGGMSDMNDNDIPFGKPAEAIIAEAVQDFDFPVAFDFPAGHINDNHPLILGAEVALQVGPDGARLDFK